MHIVHVVESFAAGTFRVLQVVANRQVADGHRLTLIHSLRDETPSDWRQQFDARIDCIYLPMRRRLAPCADFLALLRLIVVLRRLRPDIVHLHSSKAGALGRVCSLLIKGPRWFFSPHGLSFLQSPVPGQVHRLFLWVERLLALIPVSIIACSASEADMVARYLRRQAILVNNGIDFDEVPAHCSEPGADLRIGTAGRISLARNPHLFARLAGRFGSGHVSFTWLGGGDPDGEMALREAGVKVSGWLDHTALLLDLAGLDIYIQTSLWEGMPIAVLEAMAAGLPVLVSNVVGSRDVVCDGQTGLIADSEEAFVEKLQVLLVDADLRQRLGHAARASVLEHFSVENMMDDLYRGYGL